MAKIDKTLIESKKAEILSPIQEFCKLKLDDNYYQLSVKLIDKLGRKREVPFMSGKPDIWSAAIIQALGTINFLFDKSSESYVPLKEILDFFGTKKTSTDNRAREIREMLKMNYFDPEFSTMKDANPLNDFVMVDGLILPVSTLPIDLQIELEEARAKGYDLEFFTKK